MRRRYPPCPRRRIGEAGSWPPRLCYGLPLPGCSFLSSPSAAVATVACAPVGVNERHLASSADVDGGSSREVEHDHVAIGGKQGGRMHEVGLATAQIPQVRPEQLVHVRLGEHGRPAGHPGKAEPVGGDWEVAGGAQGAMIPTPLVSSRTCGDPVAGTGRDASGQGRASPASQPS